MKHMLDLSVILGKSPCTTCDKTNDSMGNHALGCGYQGKRLSIYHILYEEVTVRHMFKRLVILLMKAHASFIISRNHSSYPQTGDYLQTL